MMISHLLHRYTDSTLAPDQRCSIYLVCMYIELLYMHLLVPIRNSKSCVPNSDSLDFIIFYLQYQYGRRTYLVRESDAISHRFEFVLE